LVSSGEWQQVSGQALTPIPGEEGVHVEADTTDPQPFSEGKPKNAQFTKDK
jgi:hypothetical protein